MRIDINMYIHVCMCRYIYACMYVCTCMRVCVHTLCLHIYTCTNQHAQIFLSMCISVFTCMRVCIHNLCLHIYTCTHEHAQISPFLCVYLIRPLPHAPFLTLWGEDNTHAHINMHKSPPFYVYIRSDHYPAPPS